MCLTVLVSTVIGHYWGIKTLPAMKTWNQSIQTRVAQTAVVLGRITGVKMMGLEQVVIRYLESLRAKEVQDSMAARRIRFVINLASMCILPLFLGYLINISSAAELLVYTGFNLHRWRVLDHLERRTGHRHTLGCA